jgi:hypothetical protein
MPTIILFSAFIVFQIISEEVKSSNLIVLLKDVEKSFTEYTESHAPLGGKLPPGVLIIGSHTEVESRKDHTEIESRNDQVHLRTF